MYGVGGIGDEYIFSHFDLQAPGWFRLPQLSLTDPL